MHPTDSPDATHPALQAFVDSPICARLGTLLGVDDLGAQLRLHLGDDAVWGHHTWSGQGYYARSALILVAESLFVFAQSGIVASAPHRLLRSVRTHGRTIELDFAPPTFGEAPIEVPISDWSDPAVEAFMRALHRAR